MKTTKLYKTMSCYLYLPSSIPSPLPLFTSSSSSAFSLLSSYRFLCLSFSLSFFLSSFLPSLLFFLPHFLFFFFFFSLGLVATLTEGLLWDLSRPLVGNCTLTLLKYDDPESRTVRTCVRGTCDNYWFFAVCSCFNILYFSNREKNSDFWATD